MINLILATLFFPLHSSAAITTVPYVDLGRYAGTWYQVARKPVPFEAGCVCSRQVLTPNLKGQIDVYNSCRHQVIDGPLREIRGYAVNNNTQTNAEFIVDFGLPKKGDYWIIGLDEEYRYAVVADPGETTLYILSKTPSLDAELYAEAVDKASRQTDASTLQITLQVGCTYP